MLILKDEPNNCLACTEEEKSCGFLSIFLHFTEELATVKSDFGEQFDQRLKTSHHGI
jgi:hypothetical protein